MVTTKNSKTTKSDDNSVVKMILKSKTTWYMKTLALIIFPFIIIYLAICGILQMILYPVLYIVLTFLYDFELRDDVAYQIRKIYSTDYWWFI